jgi:6-phosphogluconolactonase
MRPLPTLAFAVAVAVAAAVPAAHSKESVTGTGAMAAAAAGGYYVYVSGEHPTITTLKLDLGSGTMTRTGTAPAGTVPSYLAFSPSKKYLYAVDEIDTSRVIAFAVDRASGRLREINRAATGGAGAPHLIVDPSGRWIVVAHYDSNSVTVHPVRPDGGVGAAIDTQKPGTSAHQAVFDASGKFLFVPCLGSNLVAQYRFVNGGHLVPNDPPTVAVAGGPRHMAFDPQERFAYVLSELENAITSFRYDRTTGRLSDPHRVPTIRSGGKKQETAHVVVHPGGKFLYVSNGNDNSIARFEIDPATGRLSNRGFERGLIRFPRDFTIDPTGRYLIVANRDSASLLTFRIDESTGKLDRVGRPIPVPAKPEFVGVLAVP